MSDLLNFVEKNRAFFDQFPGDKTEGNLTGHGDEWNAQLFLCAVLHKDSSLYYVLDFSIVQRWDEADSHPFIAILCIMLIDSESGCNDKVYIPFGGKMLQEITRQLAELEMPKRAVLPEELPAMTRLIQSMMEMEEFTDTICFDE